MKGEEGESRREVHKERAGEEAANLLIIHIHGTYGKQLAVATTTAATDDVVR